MIEYVRVGLVNSFVSINLFSSFDKRAKIENYKTKKCVPVPKERNLIVKNTYEAIISRSDFDAVQSMITSRTHPWLHNHENLFKGIIYCSHCGNRMALVYQKRKYGTVSHTYKCTTYMRNKDYCLYPTHYFIDKLYQS